MSDMFCFQCQQTAGNAGCIRVGVCGKQPETAGLQDDLVCELIGLAQAAQAAGVQPPEVTHLLMDGLFVTLTNVNFDNEAIRDWIGKVQAARMGLGGRCPALSLWEGETDLVSLRSTLLFGLKGMAAYAHHAQLLGYEDPEVNQGLYRGLAALAQEHSAQQWLEECLELGRVNLRCMELLDRAHNQSLGAPRPTRVKTDIQKGPFIVVSGHDLGILAQLLEQTEGSGVNVYTHGEMLPAHGYPELKKYSHLKGNFGTAWQNQQAELENIPAPVLFTANCLMPPRPSYADRVYTTSVVGYTGLKHIGIGPDGRRDFGPLVRQALELGGYSEDHSMGGINGGHMLTTGFGHAAVLAQADKLIEAIRSGAVRHIFLVGGCDGAHPGRNYYTDFVKNTPMDTLVLTLACGKFRFNDLDLGEIGGLPRILDMGQCNDAFSAIRVALALADAFGCSVNDLPLTLVISWYEQKAVCVLLSLLALGIKNIYLGPTLPAFLSETVLKILVERFGLQPITAPQQDLDAILGRG